MPKGGYKIVDLKNITENGAKVPNVYNQIESANGKPILLVNNRIYNRERNSMWVNFAPQGSNYAGPYTVSRDTGTVMTKIVVTPDDIVYLYNIDAVVSTSDTGGSEEDGPSASM